MVTSPELDESGEGTTHDHRSHVRSRSLSLSPSLSLRLSLTLSLSLSRVPTGLMSAMFENTG